MPATTATTATAGTILALDLGKYKSVACAYTGSPGTARFESFSTDRARLTQLLTRCHPAVVVIELDVPRAWLRRNCRQLWYSVRDIPPARFTRVIDFAEVAGASMDLVA
jgi:hypothetical protein